MKYKAFLKNHTVRAIMSFITMKLNCMIDNFVINKPQLATKLIKLATIKAV